MLYTCHEADPSVLAGFSSVSCSSSAKAAGEAAKPFLGALEIWKLSDKPKVELSLQVVRLLLLNDLVETGAENEDSGADQAGSEMCFNSFLFGSNYIHYYTLLYITIHYCIILTT